MNAPIRPNSALTELAASSGTGAVRVFVIDDSSTVRAIFSRLVSATPGLELAGSASSAEEALLQLGRLKVHVILLDLEMPGMGGMRALPEILKRVPDVRIMVVSTLTSVGAEKTVEALASGAADTLLKPGPGGFDQDYRDLLTAKICALGKRPLRRETPAPVVIARRSSFVRNAQVVAIGASTGGIHATGLLLGALPKRIGVPILVTQHLPTHFSAAFARQLEDMSGRKVNIARDGMDLLPDQIIVAPGDAHLGVRKIGERAIVQLDDRPAQVGCLPSVDVMFSSLAKCFGNHVLGVVLTGMGRDGTQGAGDLVDAGSSVIVQNEESSVVWGMPGSVAKAGLASAILHPHDLAARIVVGVGSE